MGDRRSQIVALLETLNDGLPEPTRRTNTTPGFVNEPRPRTCPDCLANGRGTMAGCETCGGTGRVTGSRYGLIATVDALPDDGQVRDPMADAKVQPYGMNDSVKLGHRPDRDAELARLAAQTRDPWASPADELADANRHPEPWEIARRRMDTRYDYPALRAALELLRDKDPQACALIHSVYVYRWADTSTTVEQIVERGLRFIDTRMPDPIRAPGFEQKPPWQKRWERKHAA